MWKKGTQVDGEWIEIESRAQERKEAAQPYLEVAIAIFKQTREDYRRKPRKRKEIIEFINSDWFEDLSFCIIEKPDEARQSFISLLEQDVRNCRKAA
jgi:thermostable 8-oxoguanine DNA glycosylase